MTMEKASTHTADITRNSNNNNNNNSYYYYYDYYYLSHLCRLFRIMYL